MHPFYLIPAADVYDGFTVTLDQSTEDGRCYFYFTKPETLHHMDSTPKPADVQKGWVDEFRTSFAKIATHMQIVPNEMRMRLHFGEMSFASWVNDQRLVYTYKEFRDTADQATRRGYGRFNKR